MPTSRFFLAPVLPPSSSPALQRTIDSPSQNNCLEAFDGSNCEPGQPDIVYITLAIVLVPILACLLVLACFKVFQIFFREPAASSGAQQEGVAGTAKREVGVTDGHMDGMKLVILAGGDGRPVVAVPREVQGQQRLPSDSEFGHENPNGNHMEESRKELEQATVLSPS